ncbi:S41 family peptidase [Mucilaginibacter sp. E4BP6]|uniref:S41 family peptidase n=1 Tax=Mucilaginibacter sp. E4BP6 TaxID=2723089 RepID=UPI0015CDF315|nr:S41 family peptidase [Mucilaginibacter sp. E4BP6]NYE65671.1 C-terminal processing protease CtpA/Prc [Mucilaginibacter sp. E4BP6]
MKKLIYLAVILISGILSSCKKDHKSTFTALNLVQDSIYYYEKEDYLWFDAIPDYNAFNPRSYGGTSNLGALTNELTAISQLKINPATGQPYEYYPLAPGTAKYSFLDDGTKQASLNGTNTDFGFEPLYANDNDLRIKYVNPNSPAAAAGLQRGYQILSINGNTDLSYDGTTSNFIINAVYYSSSITMQVQLPDGTTKNVSLSTASYTINPVLLYKVFNLGGGHVVGYMVFGSFTALANAQPQLTTAFNYFIANGVNDLVVDLRYNTGGVEKTAAYLDDLIVPADKSNTLMYTTYFNSNLQNDIYPLLAKKIAVTPGMFTVANNQTNFAKALSLNISRVFFIVTSETASSSELTINNLIPEMNVQLIGDTTYGKPVGEMPIPIGHYVLYSPQFSVENSASQGGYYNGMAPGSSTYPGILAGDDVTKNFGDSTEMLLAHALNYVQNGTYSIAIQKIQSFAQSQKLSIYQQKAINRKFLTNRFRGMVLTEKSK